MSLFVTRPEIPLPWRPEISTPCSAAIFRTTGEDRVRRRSSRSVTVPPPEDEGAGAGRAPPPGEGCPEAGHAEAGPPAAPPPPREAPTGSGCGAGLSSLAGPEGRAA